MTYIMTGFVLSIYRNKSIVRDPKPVRIVKKLNSGSVSSLDSEKAIGIIVGLTLQNWDCIVSIKVTDIAKQEDEVSSIFIFIHI